MFTHKKKKTLKTTISTPPPPPTSGSNAVKPNPNYIPTDSTTLTFEEVCCKPQRVYSCAVDTVEKIDLLKSKYDDMVKIENADIYWSHKTGTIAVVTTQEWKDYLLGKRATPILDKENDK